jgi:hypothetical protein
MEIKIAKTADDILKCFEVMHELRPTLSKENIVELISGMMTRGYHLIYIEENNRAVCASGYRFTGGKQFMWMIYLLSPKQEKKVTQENFLISLLKRHEKIIVQKFIWTVAVIHRATMHIVFIFVMVSILRATTLR